MSEVIDLVARSRKVIPRHADGDTVETPKMLVCIDWAHTLTDPESQCSEVMPTRLLHAIDGAVKRVVGYRSPVSVTRIEYALYRLQNSRSQKYEKVITSLSWLGATAVDAEVFDLSKVLADTTAGLPIRSPGQQISLAIPERSEFVENNASGVFELIDAAKKTGSGVVLVDNHPLTQRFVAARGLEVISGDFNTELGVYDAVNRWFNPPTLSHETGGSA